MSVALRGGFGLGTRARAMRLLLLAGTPEAIQIGRALARDRGLQIMASLAHPSRVPLGMRIPMRIGGWTNDAAMAHWLRESEVDAVLDATHPFATGITARCAEVCESLGIAFVQFLRPAWIPGPDDRWVFLNDTGEAARHIAGEDTVCLATGRHGLAPFAGSTAKRIFVRVRDRADGPCPIPGGRLVSYPSEPPVSAEVAGLASRGVTSVVARNTGGSWTLSVVLASRELGLPVGMIRRPLQPEVPRIRTIPEALDWVRRRI